MTEEFSEKHKLWLQAISTELYQDLRYGKYRHVLELLADQQISINKAAEAIAEISLGFEPALPTVEVNNER